MTSETLLNTIKVSNEQLRPYFTAYFKQMLQNENEVHWEADGLEDTRFIYLGYFSNEYELYFKYLDAEIDEIYQEEELSFTAFLAEKSPELAENYTGFIPNELFENYLDELQDAYMELDELMAQEFKTVFDQIGELKGNLPVVFKEEDSERFIDISDGETYDYVELKSYAFAKHTTKELLVLMQDKLETFQSYLSKYMDFVLQNEKSAKDLAKAVLISASYDAGNIQLDFLDESGEKIEKENQESYMDYLEENHSFVYRRQGAYFPFEVYDYMYTDREDEITSFKGVMDKWIITSLTDLVDKRMPRFIKKGCSDSYLDIAKNEYINLDELVLRIK